jgi:hypothetical protein
MTIEPAKDDWQFTSRADLVRAVKARRMRLQPVPTKKATIVALTPIPLPVAPKFKPPTSHWIMTLEEVNKEATPIYACVDILSAVAIVFKLNVTEIKAHRRYRKLSEARHIFFYLARKHTTLSYPNIGKYCGGYDHTSVMHGVSRVKDNIDEYQLLIDAVLNILAPPAK